MNDVKMNKYQIMVSSVSIALLADMVGKFKEFIIAALEMVLISLFFIS